MRRLSFVTALTLGLALAPAGPVAQTFRSGVDLVAVGTTVFDQQGRLVTNLSRDDFEVYEDGQRQTVQVFSRGPGFGGELPLRLGLLFDRSESLERNLPLERAAAIRFLDRVPGIEEVTLVEFDTDVRLEKYRKDELAGLVNRLREAKPSGWTAFYDAIAVYLDGEAAAAGRSMLIMYTDGEDSRSETSLGRVLDQLRGSSVTVYAVGLMSQVGPARQRLQARIQQMTDLTGGRAFFPVSLEDLDASYTGLLAELQAQYFLGYAPTNAARDGTWRKLDVRTKDPRYRIRARPGYTATRRR